jgi:hypothetical protein
MRGDLDRSLTWRMRLAAVLGALACLGIFGVSLAGDVPASASGQPSTGRALAASADPAACPLKPSSQSPTGEAWAFTQTGPPSSAHPGITSSYTHGRGTWSNGHGAGTICNEDSVSGHPSHNLVLAVAGSARISPHITRLGHLGVGLVLNVTVSASDDQTCPAQTRGTVTLFASYYQGHHDSLQLHLAGACSAYDYTYTGSQLHVLIADNGRQVN